MDDAAVADARAVLDEFGLRPGDLVELLERVRGELSAEVAVVLDERSSPGGATPEVAFDDVAAGSVSDAARAAIRRRGVVVVRNTFDVEEAEEWDRDIEAYLRRNRFDERFARPDPTRKAPGARIWGIYWSRPQVAARQHRRMVAVRRFLNGFWSHGGDGVFDAAHDIGYPDRVRRRPPGVASRGLPLHTDAPTTGGWRIAENRRTFADLLAGRPERYDPWDATERCRPIDPGDAATAPSSVFRTFQGWTALSEMRPEDGGLHTIPIPSASMLTVLDGLAGELGLTGEAPVAAPPRARPPQLLADAATPVPAVEPGDSVWWHGDVFHSVADAANQERWSNLMYIGSSPRCARNERYAPTMLDRFVAGRSPVDYPAEDVEVDFVGRAGLDDLDEVGRQQFGLDPVGAA